MENQNPFESQIQNQNEGGINQNQIQQQQQLVQENPQVFQTEQQAQAAVEYAGFWARFAANMVDGLVLIIPSAIVQSIYGDKLGTFMSYVLLWAYAIYMLTNRQATLGKMAVGLKVTKVNGEYGTASTFAMREILGKIVNIITLGIGYLMIVFTQKKQGLHDMIADTVVIYDKQRRRRQWLVVLGVIFALIVPVMGIIAGIVLVSTNSAREKALDKKIEAEQKAIEIQKQIERESIK